MKKLLLLMISAMACIAMLTGCGAAGENRKDDGKYSIVCTTFPQYDWIREIAGECADSFELTLLLDNGGELHSYQPTAQDMVEILSADLFVYVGGESDEWVEDALKGAANENMTVVNLMERLGDAVREEEAVEGMQDAETHDGEETEYDEHVWLSVKNAAALTQTLLEELSRLDAANAQTYAANAAAYVEKLTALDREYADAAAGSEKKTILFGDRFPFRYLADDYGLDYYAAFAGCSTETEASFETITFLAGKADELGLDSILVIDGSDKKIAEAIRQNTQSKNQRILTMDSMQSVTSDDIDNGFTYLDAMQDNLEVLKEALS
ncbi:MAG: metal ABC transporter substrate-binding protein [Lachnospiraceae bacterium]|nr:metal ABC transporter substrate-binding protein [Lachnospiraceae bacterium]